MAHDGDDRRPGQLDRGKILQSRMKRERVSVARAARGQLRKQSRAAIAYRGAGGAEARFRGGGLRRGGCCGSCCCCGCRARRRRRRCRRLWLGRCRGGRWSCLRQRRLTEDDLCCAELSRHELCNVDRQHCAGEEKGVSDGTAAVQGSSSSRLRLRHAAPHRWAEADARRSGAALS